MPIATNILWQSGLFLQFEHFPMFKLEKMKEHFKDGRYVFMSENKMIFWLPVLFSGPDPPLSVLVWFITTLPLTP